MNAYQVYRQTEAQTASPAELVVMLYRGAVRFAAAGAVAIESHQLEAAHQSLVRAQDILVELLGTLDLERGGEIAENLQALYQYLHHRLVESNLHKDPAAAREAETLMRELLGAWEHAARAAAPPARESLAA